MITPPLKIVPNRMRQPQEQSRLFGQGTTFLQETRCKFDSFKWCLMKRRGRIEYGGDARVMQTLVESIIHENKAIESSD